MLCVSRSSASTGPEPSSQRAGPVTSRAPFNRVSELRTRCCSSSRLRTSYRTPAPSKRTSLRCQRTLRAPLTRRRPSSTCQVRWRVRRLRVGCTWLGCYCRCDGTCEAAHMRELTAHWTDCWHSQAIRPLYLLRLLSSARWHTRCGATTTASRSRSLDRDDIPRDATSRSTIGQSTKYSRERERPPVASWPMALALARWLPMHSRLE